MNLQYMKSLLTLFCLLSSLFLIGQEKNAQDESIRTNQSDIHWVMN